MMMVPWLSSVCLNELIGSFGNGICFSRLFRLDPEVIGCPGKPQELVIAILLGQVR